MENFPTLKIKEMISLVDLKEKDSDESRHFEEPLIFYGCEFPPILYSKLLLH